jgi:hypothetical protein
MSETTIAFYDTNWQLLFRINKCLIKCLHQINNNKSDGYMSVSSVVLTK